jgi:subtilase family serine protease
VPRTTRRVRAVTATGALALAVPLIGLGAASGQAATHAAGTSRHPVRVCGTPAAGTMACDAYVQDSAADKPLATATPSGYGPSQLQSAYKLAAASSADGGGKTIAIVDAYTDPTAAADLAVYRNEFGLPACTVANGCFKEESQTGTSSLPASNASWAEEISLDLDMVSAICPNCHILLMAAKSPTTANLGTAVNTAAGTSGVVAVSNSYGGNESSSDPTYDTKYYDHPGVAVTASAGDGGYGVEYPAASRYVTAVGGTSLTTSSNSRGWTEKVWDGSGSGCSADDAKPTWQKDTGCSKRTVADVSADADPNTGVAVYDSTSYEGSKGWLVFGGTSVASPIIASTYGLGATLASGTQTSNLYSHSSSLFDVTSGSNGSCGGTYLCTGEVGYDGPTGLGTPDGVGAF